MSVQITAEDPSGDVHKQLMQGGGVEGRVGVERGGSGVEAKDERAALAEDTQVFGVEKGHEVALEELWPEHVRVAWGDLAVGPQKGRGKEVGRVNCGGSRGYKVMYVKALMQIYRKGGAVLLRTPCGGFDAW